MCGEQIISANLNLVCLGSPPRVRGTGYSTTYVPESERITPACAGNRDRNVQGCIANEDHPRVCGEQSLMISLHGDHTGSPPRVRGTGCLTAFQLAPPRITPACAGNRTPAYEAKLRKQDHPRVCGEQTRDIRDLVEDVGSPPRVRGTVRRHPAHKTVYRITPACAGNRKLEYLKQLTPEDHPRVCGEQPVIQECFDRGLGSPPRVRGTANAGHIIKQSFRITPACAGNSFLSSC